MINNSEEHFGTITEYLNLINKSEDTLHPHHWLLTQIRFHILNNESFDKTDPEVCRVKVEQSRQKIFYENSIFIKKFLDFFLKCFQD